MHANPVNSVNPENPDSDNKQPLGPDNVSGVAAGGCGCLSAVQCLPQTWNVFKTYRPLPPTSAESKG